MTEFAGALEAAGDALRAAAGSIGADISFDVRAALTRDAPVPLAPPCLWSANRHCRLVRAADGWLAVNLARPDDRDTVPAWLESPLDADPWDSVVSRAKRQSVAQLLEGAIRLQLPVAAVGEAAARRPAPLTGAVSRRTPPLVADLSALWAGPSCAALLAGCGLDVVKVECPGRPDPTGADIRLNGAKRRMTVDLDSPELFELLASADVLVTSARPLALARLGLTPATLFAANPGLIWVAITAHGWSGDAALRVGFGDDCAAAGGLLTFVGDEPRFLGDALGDPLTGLVAATAALSTLARGGAGLLDAPLSGIAASFA